MQERLVKQSPSLGQQFTPRDQLAKWMVRSRPKLHKYGYPAVSQNTNCPHVLPGLDRDSLERGGQHLEYRARAASTYWPPSS